MDSTVVETSIVCTKLLTVVESVCTRVMLKKRKERVCVSTNELMGVSAVEVGGGKEDMELVV